MHEIYAFGKCECVKYKIVTFSNLFFVFFFSPFFTSMFSRIVRPRSIARVGLIRGFSTRINPILNNNDDDAKSGRASEIIEAVLYGSKKIKEIETQTHSKMLARGKYVHELQCKLETMVFCTCTQCYSCSSSCKTR